MSSPTSPTTKRIRHHTIPTFTFQSGATLSPLRLAWRAFGNPFYTKKILIPSSYRNRINSTITFTTPIPGTTSPGLLSPTTWSSSACPATANPPALQHRKLPPRPRRPRLHPRPTPSPDPTPPHHAPGRRHRLLYYWACMYPTFATSIVPAFLEGAEAALLNSVDYADGAYKTNGVKPVRGLHAFGRACCASALSAEWFRRGLWGERQAGWGYETLEGFMREVWDESLEELEDLLALMRMRQRGDVGMLRADGDVGMALSQVKARVLIMPCRTDQYFPPEVSEYEVKGLRHGKLAVIESVWGHIAGTGANDADTAWMDQQIAKSLT